MSAPTFRVGEEIYSKTLMGKIRFAYVYDGNWFYVIGPVPPSEAHAPEQIQDIDVIAVWRDGRWTGK